MEILSGAATLKALASDTLVHTNLPVAQLVEIALMRGEARLAANGALVAYTGARTGRSPKDKFTVDDEVTHSIVDWGRVNWPLSLSPFPPLLDRVTQPMFAP